MSLVASDVKAPTPTSDSLDASLDRRRAVASPSRATPARPLSSADYFARLRTFADCASWTFGKNETLLGAVACASRGWKVVRGERDALTCETCGAALCYPKADGYDALDDRGKRALDEEMAGKLITGHDENCAWGETACGRAARAFPLAADDGTTRSDFASRVDGIARGKSQVPMCVDVLSVNCARGRVAGMSDDVADRARALVADARAHAEDAETSAAGDDRNADDSTPLERRTVVDHATLMALFGWSPVSVDDDASRRCYACALCGAMSPEWIFTSISATRKERMSASSKKQSAKRPKTTLAALRGAAGGSYGLGSTTSSTKTPFAPELRNEKSHSAKANWIAATAAASVESKLFMSIAGGGERGDAVPNAAPFGATTSSTPLFGSPRPVTAHDDAHDGSKFASVVVAAMTKKLAERTKKRRRVVSLDPDAKLEPPPGSTLFDVVNEHASYCPWIACERGLPGWRQTLDVLIPPKLSERSQDERARNFRVVDYVKAREMVRRYCGAGP